MGARDRPTTEGSVAEPGAHACTHDRARGWRDWEYPRPGRVLDVFDDMALVVEQREGATGLYLYEIDTARVTEVLLSEPAAEVQRAGFTSDGSVLVLARVGSLTRPGSAVGVARPGQPVPLRSLGYLARDVAMADGRQGMAVGRTAEEVSITTDGGLTWTSEVAGLDGDATRVELDPGGQPMSNARALSARRTGELVECGGVACRAGSRLVHYWSEPAPAEPVFE